MELDKARLISWLEKSWEGDAFLISYSEYFFGSFAYTKHVLVCSNGRHPYALAGGIYYLLLGVLNQNDG